MQMVVAAIVTLVLLLPLVRGIFLVQVLYVLGVAVVSGVVVFGMRSRRSWVRWAGVAIQAVLVILYVLQLSVQPSLEPVFGLGLAVAALVLLLTSSSAAWFDDSSGRGA
ncbi:hypothetical protein [Nonomuraea harbinensis]|uniref:Integral membrane protein n=1 Tax=Nonomuraea harbinensis TaxID=1286938 RepID=A0ABW1BST5_9ACTN|nr:hypothetical protein [Nonomuraea harbinensis]